MKKVLSCPGKFIAGESELDNLGTYLKPYGERALLVALPEDADRVRSSLDKVKADGVELIVTDFGGECSQMEIDRLGEVCKSSGAQVVVGLGGGKAIDTSKGVSHYQKLPLVVVPTVAASDAPCSTLIILYDEAHTMCGFLKLPKNPDVVLIDTLVVSKAPVRFLVAGIADAFATYFEARACMRTNANNYVGGKATNAAWALARLCHETLLEDGEKAVAACKEKLLTPALENVIEANILLSGLGFESVGCAAAHALHNALTAIEDTHKSLHGEKVAIGLLVQLVLENAPSEELAMVIDFYRRIGLPTRLSGIGITEVTEQKLRIVAKAAVKPGAAIHNHPFAVTEDMVYHALCYVDTLDKIY